MSYTAEPNGNHDTSDLGGPLRGAAPLAALGGAGNFGAAGALYVPYQDIPGMVDDSSAAVRSACIVRRATNGIMASSIPAS